MSFRILSIAELEATQAAFWYERQRPGFGDEFLTQLRRTLDRIRDTPQAFGRLEQYQGRRDIRRALLEQFPYLVIFEVSPTETLIVAVSHVRRSPLHWMKRRS